MTTGLWLEARGEVTTHIIVTTQLLTLPAAQLEEAIAAELAANPALEQVEARHCPRCGTLVRQPPCPRCLARLTGRPAMPDYPGGSRAGRPDDEDQDLADYVAQPVSLAEYVLAQIGPMLRRDEHAVAADILENLDERGYYADIPESAAARLGVPVARMLAALRAVQSAEPAGIAARDARECLLLQLAHLRAQGQAEATALPERLVRTAWAALTRGDIAAIAHAAGCPEADARTAVAFLRNNLAPYPALTHWGVAARCAPAETYARPDAAVFLREDGELDVEIFALGPEWLRVNPLFRQHCQDEQCRELVERAGLFIKCLGQRQNTFVRLLRALLVEQRDYFLRGDRYLRPLTRAEMAGILGVHESTASRAVADKIIGVPGGRLVPLAHLFDGSVAIKDLLAELVAHESHPLTDDQLAQRLADMGHPLARRTVAKYRTAIGILPANLRQSTPRAVHAAGTVTS